MTNFEENCDNTAALNPIKLAKSFSQPGNVSPSLHSRSAAESSSSGAVVVDSNHRYLPHGCLLINCHWPPNSLFLPLLTTGLFLLLSTVATMYKVSKGLTKRAERNIEDHRGSATLPDSQKHNGANGTVVAPLNDNTNIVGRIHNGGGFSESSSFETHEHYERRLVKRSKRDRDSQRRSLDRNRAKGRSVEDISPVERDALLKWAQKVTAGYPGVNVKNFTTSWKDGLAFNAILHRHRPDLVSWRDVQLYEPFDRLMNAFKVAENEFGVHRSLKPEELDVVTPEERPVAQYVFSLYEALPNETGFARYERDINEYEVKAKDFNRWLQKSIQLMEEKKVPSSQEDLDRMLAELARFRAKELPPKAQDLDYLDDLYNRLLELFGGTEMWAVDDDLTGQSLRRSWKRLQNALDFKESSVESHTGLLNSKKKSFDRIELDIGVVNEKLDRILERIEDAEAKLSIVSASESKRVIDGIVYDLNDLESPIESLFAETDRYKADRSPKASEYSRQVFGLHQRRVAYLQRCETQLLVELGQRSETVTRMEEERYTSTRTRVFSDCEESIRWIEKMIHHMETMEFVEEITILEEMFEQHRIDHRDVMDFRHNVDRSIARQAEVSAEDSGAYCDLLSRLEDQYEMLRHYSTGRVLDLDSLIAFVRGAHQELRWISDRENIEVTRDWSDINRLDTPMLQNYYKQLLHELELREEQHMAVYNQGSALINQQHPGSPTIETYLINMQNQWDWLVHLAQCFQGHLQDACNLKQYLEECQLCEQWMERQWELLTHYDNAADEGSEAYLKELDEIDAMLRNYSELLISLHDRSLILSPLWQRGEPISRAMPVNSLCDYDENNIHIRRGDECLLLDNSDPISWLVRTPEGYEALVPSVVFRLPPPDERVVGYFNRLKSLYERLRKLSSEKKSKISFDHLLKIIRTILTWDLATFAAIPADQRDSLLKNLNEDGSSLLGKCDPNDPAAMKFRDELRLANEHYYKLLQMLNRGPVIDDSDLFDKKCSFLLERLDEFRVKLDRRVKEKIPKNVEELETIVRNHHEFEDALQSLDSDVAMVQELFRQLRDPSPLQRTRLDQLMEKWESIWELSRMFVERLKYIELVLNGLAECNQLITQHEITLGSFDYMPATLEKLRAEHSQLVELQLVLQQHETIIHQLASDVGRMRQHVSRTRYNIADHPDVDLIENEVQKTTVRWENICDQVVHRLKSADIATQLMLIYRPEYDHELAWLDRIEATINSLRDPSHLRHDEFQSQLDILMAEYSHLQERTQAIENVNREGGKFIREARFYDLRLNQYVENLEEIHSNVNTLLKKRNKDLMPGADIVAKELEALNRRFAQLSTFMLERQNVINVLMQKWKRQMEEEMRQKGEEDDRQIRLAREEEDRLARERERLRREQEERDRLAELERRRREQEERDRLERERLAELERQRLADMDRLRREQEEKDRLKREQAERDRLRKEQEERDRLERERLAELERKRREQEERDRQADLDRKRREQEERDRLKREQDERDRLADLERKRREQEERDRLRKQQEDQDRLRREQEERDRLKREQEERDRLRREQEERDRLERERQAELDRQRRAQEERDRLWREEEERRKQIVIEVPKPKEEVIVVKRAETPPPPPPRPPSPKLNIQTGMQWGTGDEGEEAGTFEELGEMTDRARIAEHEDEMNLYEEWTVDTRQFYELEAVKHMQTGEILTFVEAIREGLLDLRSEEGEFFDIVSGSKISLSEAVQRGYVSESFSDCLQTKYGIRDPNTGEEVNLLEAIQRGIYDPDCRQLRDPVSGELFTLVEAVTKKVVAFDNVHKLIKMGILKLPPIQLEDALEQKVVNVETGVFTGKYSRESISMRDALKNGYIAVTSPVAPTIAVTLTDCIEQNYIDPQTGEFLDKNTNEKITLRDAVSRTNQLINMNVREIINTNERKRITVSEAVVRNVLNTRQGNFTDLIQRQSITLQDAYSRDLIQKPLILREICAKDLIDTTGRLIDVGTKKKLTILEAVAEGLLDPDVPQIIDPVEKDVISLVEAFERGVFTAEGNFVNEATNETLSMREAYSNHFFTERGRFTLFEVKGIKNTRTNATVNFIQAVDEGVVDLAAEQLVNLATGQRLPLADGVEQGVVDPILHKTLSTVSGLKSRSGQDVNVFGAVCNGSVDYRNGTLLTGPNQPLTPKEAYSRGLISLRGAMLFTAIFNVHPTLVPQPKVHAGRRKKRTGTSAQQSQQDQIKMTLEEALKQGLVDGRSQKFRKDGEEMSVHEALSRGLVNPEAEWIVPSRGTHQGGPVIEERTTELITETSQVLAPKHLPNRDIQETLSTVKRQRTTETTSTGGMGGVSAYKAITGGKGLLEVPVTGMHISEAVKRGLIDLETGTLSVPDAGRTLTMEETVELGIINPHQIQVKDPKTGVRCNIAEAIDRGFMDSTGHVVNPLTGEKLSLESAIAKEFVIIEPDTSSTISAPKKVIHFGGGYGPVMSFTPKGTASLEENEEGFHFDAIQGIVVDLISGEALPIDVAVSTGKVPTDALMIKDVLTERTMPYADAIKWGIIDPSIRAYKDKKANRTYSLLEAAKMGLVTVGTAGAASAARAGDTPLQTTVKYQSRKLVATKEAAVAGPTAFVDYSLQRVIDLGWYNPATGLFTHPDTRKQMTFKDAIVKGLFNPYESSVVDPATGDLMSLLDGIQIGLIDANAGCLVNSKTGEKINLKEACEQLLIRSGLAPQPLDVLLHNGRLNLSSNQVETVDGSPPMKLNEAILRGVVRRDSILVKDPVSGESLSFDTAVNRKIVDLDRGLVVNHASGEAVSLSQAITAGVLQPIPSKTGSQMQQIVTKSQPLSSEVTYRQQQQSQLSGEHRGAMVKVIKGEDGVEKGEYIDPNTGSTFIARLQASPYVTQTKTTVKSKAQVQAIELNPNAEMAGIDKVRDTRTGRVMSLQEAERAGLVKVDKKGKLQTKSYAVFRSDIGHALSEGVVNPSDGSHCSLQDAIRLKLVDIQNLTYTNPTTGDLVDLVRAANMGLVDVTLAEVLPKGVCNPANGERISTRRAVELNIIDPKSGKVANPFKKEDLSWLDVLKPVYASLTMEGVYDPRQGYAVPITSALNEGLIDPRTRLYSNPITNESCSLDDAAAKGLIDESSFKALIRPAIPDWRSGQNVCLLDAVAAGLIDTHNRTFAVGKGVILPIGKAIQEGRFPADIGAQLKRVDKLTFAEALGKGLIDIPTNTFHDTDTGKKMTISQALESGFIDTGSVESLEGRDHKNLSNVIKSEEFDVNSGRIRDPTTRLYLTFRQAMDRGIIDEDSLIHDVDSGRTITLREAIDIGKIDNNGKYVDTQTGSTVGLIDAEKAGLIAIISSPMLAGQAVAEAVKRRETEGLRFKLESEKKSSPSGIQPTSRLIEEVTSVRYTPRSVEPTFSLRVKTDDSAERLRSFMDDPQTIADKQFEFISNLERSGYDLQIKSIRNPEGNETYTVNEAIERGLLDVITGEIVNTTSGRRYNIPKAVHMGVLQPKAAERIMGALNLSMEELRHQGWSPSKARQSADFSPTVSSTSTVTRTITEAFEDLPGARTVVMKERHWRDGKEY